MLAGAAPIPLAGDLNSKHIAWVPGPSDVRGREPLRFVIGSVLIVLNDPASPPTYSNVYTESCIDVALAFNGVGWGALVGGGDVDVF